MVERLKDAIAKARLARGLAGQSAAPPARPATTEPYDGQAWDALPQATLDPGHLERNRVVSFGRTDGSHVPFDILRTRLLKICADMGLRRVGVTSPRKACGKTLVTLNLAFSIARLAEARAIVLDLDLRAPSVARRLGLSTDRRMADLLSGASDAASFLVRAGDRLAFGLNGRVETDGAELIQSESATRALAAVAEKFRPTIILYDLPPMLAGDDALSSLDVLDGVLLVTAAGETTPADLLECEQQLSERERLIGVVLNKSADVSADMYQYAPDADGVTA